MKRKGFTLIELLAVIVVLAIIALIATPMVLNTISETKKGAAKASATAYIKAVEKQVVANQMNDKNPIIDGIYKVGDLTYVKMKGTTPTNGQLTILDGEVTNARLYIDGYSIDYDGKNVEISNNSYSGNGEVILNINDEELKKQISPTVEFDITGKDISSITNIVCNNGVEVNVEDNKVIITNVLGDTMCTMNTSLGTTINNLDTSENYIAMLSDEILGNGLTIEENEQVKLNLNEKTITYNTAGDYIFDVLGYLEINGTNGTLNGTAHSIKSQGKSNLVINGGTYNYLTTYGNGVADIKNSVHKCTVNKNNCYPIWLSGNATTNYDNIYIESDGKTFGMGNNSTATIKNSTLICHADSCVYDKSEGSLILNNVEINAYGYAVKNDSANGKIEIIDSTINAANSESSSYAVEQRSTDDQGIINIYNSTIESSRPSIYLTGSGNINVYNSNVTSDSSVVVNNLTGIININGGTYIGLVNGSNEYSWVGTIVNKNQGEINISGNTVIKNNGTKDYSNIAVFNDGTGTLKIDGKIARFDEFGNYQSGIYIETQAGAGIRNNGTLYVNGITVNSVDNALTNVNDEAVTYIKSGEFKSNVAAVRTEKLGTVNICSATLDGTTYDLAIDSTGYINYNSNVVLKNNTIYDNNNPTHVVLNDSLVCE